MSSRHPSIGRRLLPAVALTGVGFGLVRALDRPLAVAAPDSGGLLPNGTSTTLMPVPEQTTTTIVAVAVVPDTTVAPAPVAAVTTTVPAAPNKCGATVTTGAQASIYEHRQYGVISVIAKFNSAGTLCKVSANYQVYDGRSERYEQYAVPILNRQAMKARSANINGISGATAVSRAYAQSLQSAIDQKG